MPVVEATGVSHAFGQGRARRVVLSDVSVRFDEARVGIIGANGSGKSTFARMLNGLVEPYDGSVRVDGLDVSRHGREVRKMVGFCFTDPDAQIVMPTVREDIAFTLKSSGLSKDEVARRVQMMMDRFGLAAHGDHPAHLLSGGQKQLLALAAVLISEPRMLVMDEPTTLLDLRNSRMIGDVVAGLEHQVVLVTHHLDLLRDFERVLVFEGGRLACDDSPVRAIDYYRSIAR